jgi:PAT family beta-lactamase induction signal transducer AmpG
VKPEYVKQSFRMMVRSKNLWMCLIAGFSSGLPLYVLVQLVPVWLKSASIDLKVIGFLTLVQLPYAWKFLWSPLLDRWRLPLFEGRRIGWLFWSQLSVFSLIASLGLWKPELHGSFLAWPIVVWACAIAFFSATQDVVLDALRCELVEEHQQGLGAAFYVNAYRFSSLIPGSLSLVLSDSLPWNMVFFITGLFMLPGLFITHFVLEEPKSSQYRQNNYTQSWANDLMAPFVNFFSRIPLMHALSILAFLFLYKLGDNMATALSSTFYMELGFSRTEIGLVAKNAALWPMLFGSVLAGLWMMKIGLNKSLWIFGVFQWLSILGFWLLVNGGLYDGQSYTARLWVLGSVIAFEYFGVGLGTVALLAFMAKYTHPDHTATQFALFSALASVPRVIINAYTGVMVESMGWSNFFVVCAFLALPGLLLLMKIAPWDEHPS